MLGVRQLFSKRFDRGQSTVSDTALLGYSRYLNGRSIGRALLSYLPEPLRQELSGQPENEFSNRGIARSLPRALNELGYIVDIVSWDDTSFSSDHSYDLLVQHGGINYEQLRPLVKQRGKIIYFSSGSYWKYHNSAERKRFVNFEKRHGFKPPYDRFITNPEEKANQEANGIVALGNADVVKTYSKFKEVFHLNLASYPDTRKISKNPVLAKNNFLFFAGGGAIHKGLDLALEAFADLEQHLYIVAHIEDKVMPAYKDILKQPNIHYIGPLDFRSPQYYEVMDKCAFAILPSCSEGQPGSMVECLAGGLIPLVTRDVHIDIGEFGFLIKPSKGEIKKAVNVASCLSTPEISNRSKLAIHAARTAHSPKLFVSNFKKYVKQIAGSDEN